MTKIKIEHIDQLTRGKKSGAKIGSRAVPHHLYLYEKIKYEQAMKRWYLEIETKERVNLTNIWQKVCEVKKQDCYILEKNMLDGSAHILKNFETIFKWTLQDTKQKIKELI
jgi:hypothetical protein